MMTSKCFMGIFMCIALKTSFIEANWSKGETLFHAARMGNLPEVRSLLNDGVSPDEYETPSGHTALIIAVSNNYAEIVDVLLSNPQQPANPNARVTLGCTALHYAAFRTQLDMIKNLCDHGADPNAQSSRDCDFSKEQCTWRQRKDVPEGTGLSPLMSSAIANRVKAVQALLDNGADINLQSFTGNTALHYSTMYNAKEVATFLLQHGANASIKNKRGQTAKDIAIKKDSEKVRG
ncbi:unnamed protein product, partial [Meganyctiphanes norvegica]